MGSRGLSPDEAGLLRHVMHFGSDAYPIQKIGSHSWTWGPWRTIQGPPKAWRTRREAVANFEAFLDILRDAKAGRI